MNKSPTLLVVDDNLVNLKVLLDHLSHSGYKTLIAQNGDDAIEQAEYAQPDLIILDVRMPGMNGFETCGRLKKNEITKEIPVIFMTALNDTEDKVKGFKVGAVDYITKPFQQEEVLIRIKTHLMVRQLQKTLQEKNMLLEEKNEELHNLNQTLEDKNKELQTLSVSKDRFFSIIAHDLKGPFNSFILGTEILSTMNDISPERMKNVAINLNKSAEQMKKLLDNLLKWAQMQMGSMEFKPQKIDLKNAIGANLSLLQNNFSQKKIEVINHIQESIFVHADLNMIVTVLRNLLTNAWKFTPKGGKIEIFTQEKDDEIEISVSDTGVGIKAENIDKLFRIDAKYRQRGTDDEKGTGLGLILCKDLIEKHGGRITAESEYGKGSIFRFTIPKDTTGGQE